MTRPWSLLTAVVLAACATTPRQPLIDSTGNAYGAAAARWMALDSVQPADWPEPQYSVGWSVVAACVGGVLFGWGIRGPRKP